MNTLTPARNHIATKIRGQAIDRIWDHTTLQVREQAREQVSDKVLGQVRDQVRTLTHSLFEL